MTSGVLSSLKCIWKEILSVEILLSNYFLNLPCYICNDVHMHGFWSSVSTNEWILRNARGQTLPRGTHRTYLASISIIIHQRFETHFLLPEFISNYILYINSRSNVCAHQCVVLLKTLYCTLSTRD
jgi:hypothetical protein